MSFLQLAGRNAWRKPVRTLLMMLCVAVAFVVYGLTASFEASSQGAAGASDDRLVVTSKAGRTQPLPLSHLRRIEELHDVAASAYASRLRGFVVTERNVVAASAVDPRRLGGILGRELGLTPQMLEDLGRKRDSVLVGRALAEAQNWSVGERIGVTALQIAKTDGSRNWTFEIAGIFEGESPQIDTYFMLARYDYVNATRMRDKDTVDAFVVVPRHGVTAAVLAPAIDALFANSAAPTRTQPEKQFLEAFLRQIADIGLIVDLVVGAAFVTILMIVVNTMVFAIRERTFEIGVLKTFGFSRRRIMALVLAEALIVFAVGGTVGLLVAYILCGLADPVIGLAFTAAIPMNAAALIVGLGLASGLLPAVNAMRLPIVSAFKSR